MTGSEHGLRALRDFGIEGVLADALDAQAVDAALRKVRRAAVIDELMDQSRHKAVTVCEQGVRHGILLREAFARGVSA